MEHQNTVSEETQRPTFFSYQRVDESLEMTSDANHGAPGYFGPSHSNEPAQAQVSPAPAAGIPGFDSKRAVALQYYADSRATAMGKKRVEISEIISEEKWVLSDKTLKSLINKFLSESTEEAQNPSIDIVKHAEKSIKQLRSSRHDEIQRRIRDHRERFDRFWDESQSVLNSLLKSRQELESMGYDQGIKTQAERFARAIENNSFFKFEAVIRDEIILSTQPVTLKHKNPAAGVDITLDVGRFAVVFRDTSIRVKPLEDNLALFDCDVDYHDDHDGCEFFFHPHVSEAGVICFGDVSNQARDLLREGNLADILPLIASILTTYNETGGQVPWVNLVRFKYDSDDCHEYYYADLLESRSSDAEVSETESDNENDGETDDEPIF